VFYSVVRWASIPLFALYFRLAVEGEEHVPDTGAAIVAGNHVSYLDPAVLGSACPRTLHFLMDGRIFRRRGLSWFFRGMEAVPVERDRSGRETIRASLSHLDAGRAIGIFPEGGRTAPDRPLEPLAGVALLARRTGALVVPVGITGTERSMPLGKTLPEPVKVRVRFGEPLRPADAGGGGRAAREADQAFTAELMARIARLRGDEARTAP